MTLVYTQANLTSDINRHLQGKQGMLVNIVDTANEAVRTVLSEVDLRSTRRKASLAPNLFNGIFDYACPSDLKANGIIDIPQQATRSDGEFNLVPSREFETNKKLGDISIDDYNGTRVLKINSRVDSKNVVIAELDSLTSSGTWSAFGDGASVSADTDDFIKGNGALKFNISAAAGTTAGIVNSTLNNVDLTDYLGGNGAVFVWAKINSTTGLTNFILRLGSSSSNYYSKTITTQSDGTAFVNGWNLLRFNLSSLTTTGTPVDASVVYAALYMTKLTTKVSESDYKFDWLVLKDGRNADVKYYSKFGWTTSGGTYIENSTTSTDYVVADTDEYDLIVKKGIAIGTRELDFPRDVKDEKDNDYKQAKAEYMMRNPSETPIMTNEYYSYN